MKKVIGVLVIGLGFTVVSCQKEDIKPTVSPVAQGEMQSRSQTVTSTTSGTGVSGGEITDPNSDPDGNKRKSSK